MSEFSESIYLRSSDRDAGVQWLISNDLVGYVLEPRGGWLQVFADWADDSEDDDRTLSMENSVGTLVYYCFAEDFLWSFMVYQDGEPFFGYECAWDLDEYQIAGVPVEKLAEKFDLPSVKLKKIFYTGGEDGKSADELKANAAELADLLELPNYAYASFHYADIDAADTGLSEFYVDPERGGATPRQTPPPEQHHSPSTPQTPSTPKVKQEDSAPWQAAYNLASHFLKRLHDAEHIELNFDTRLARDRLIERLTKTVIYNPVSTHKQVVHHWLESLMKSPEIVDVFATDDELMEIFEEAMKDVEAAQ